MSATSPLGAPTWRAIGQLHKRCEAPQRGSIQANAAASALLNRVAEVNSHGHRVASSQSPHARRRKAGRRRRPNGPYQRCCEEPLSPAKRIEWPRNTGTANARVAGILHPRRAHQRNLPHSLQRPLRDIGVEYKRRASTRTLRAMVSTQRRTREFTAIPAVHNATTRCA